MDLFFWCTGKLFDENLKLCMLLSETTSSCLCFHVTAQIGNTQTELKKLAELNPELKDAYLAKQRRLKVSQASRVSNKQNYCLLLHPTPELGAVSPKAVLP